MTSTRLQDDLLQEFREEKKMISSQIEIFEPMAMSLRKPAAQRLVNKGLILFVEVLCWLSVLCVIAFGIFLNKLYPFYILFQLKNKSYTDKLGFINVQNLQIGIYSLIAAIGALLFFLARALAKVRKKNDILSVSGKHIKTLVGQQLNRRAAIEAIEQRHFQELPHEHVMVDANEVPNPGYEG